MGSQFIHLSSLRPLAVAFPSLKLSYGFNNAAELQPSPLHSTQEEGAKWVTES